MKHFSIFITIILLAWNGFCQLNVVDSKPAQTTTTNGQSNNISIRLPFTAIPGSNDLVDNYLCYNGQDFYLLAKKTSSPSDKNVVFVLGTNREAAVQTLKDLQEWLSNNTIGAFITVEMGGTKHTITKKEEGLLSFTNSSITGAWLLDESQLQMSMRQLTLISREPKQDHSTPNPSDGGGIGYGCGHRGMINNIDATVNEEGQVCVEVHIAADGHVIDARVINNSKHRTTITNRNIQQQCVARAKQAIYKPGKEELRVIVFS
jgi:hypothetical protein